MSLSDDQIQKIIERAQSSINATNAAQNSCAAGQDCALVLVPGFVPAPERALAALATQYGKNLQLVFLSDAVFAGGGTPACRLDWATQQNELVELLVRAEHAVLLAPGTALLARMGAGESPEDFSEGSFAASSGEKRWRCCWTSNRRSFAGTRFLPALRRRLISSPRWASGFRPISRAKAERTMFSRWSPSVRWLTRSRADEREI